MRTSVCLTVYYSFFLGRFICASRKKSKHQFQRLLTNSFFSSLDAAYIYDKIANLAWIERIYTVTELLRFALCVYNTLYSRQINSCETLNTYINKKNGAAFMTERQLEIVWSLLKWHAVKTITIKTSKRQTKTTHGQTRKSGQPNWPVLYFANLCIYAAAPIYFYSGYFFVRYFIHLHLS